MSRRRSQIGFRREVAFVLLLALLVLVAVSAFTLFSYRNAVELLIVERRAAALEMSRKAAEILSATDVGTAQALTRSLPGVRSVSLLDASGQVRFVTDGDPAPVLPVGLDLEQLTEPLVSGPDTETPRGIVAIAPFQRRGQRLFLRLELAADRLAAQQRAVRWLTVVVLVTDVAVVALLLFFLDRILGPYETLLRRARETDGSQAGDEDEMGYLVATFERALATLTERDADDFEKEIGALQRTLARSLESGVLVLDRRQRLVAVNDIGRALIGISAIAEPEDFRRVLQSHPEMVTALEAAVSLERSVQRREIELTNEAGTRVLGLTIHPLRRDDGQVRGYLGLFADLTETRRQAEEQRLARSLSQLGEMTAGIAHELRNSLATLKGYLTLIERRPDEESVTDYLAEIRDESDHLQRVLEDFLSFARPGSLRLETVDLGAVARRVARDPQIPYAVVVDDQTEDGGPVHADRDLIARAVHNLVHNAVLAQSDTNPSQAVVIQLTRAVDGVRVRVLDRGPGLSATVRDRLFQPFVTGRPGGTGMGLAVAHQIVDLHGGRLRIEDRDGGGTIAEIRFPLDTLATNRSKPSLDPAS